MNGSLRHRGAPLCIPWMLALALPALGEPTGPAAAAPPSNGTALSITQAWPVCADDGLWCAAFAPTDDVTATLVATLELARSSIQVAAFNVSSDELTAALVGAAQRGVDVLVLVDWARPENDAMRRLAVSPGVRLSRVPSLRGGGPQMHHKMLLVDGTWLVVGTGNLTAAAMAASTEAFVATRDAETVAAASGEFASLLRRVREACLLFAEPIAACAGLQEQTEPRRSDPDAHLVELRWDEGFDAFARTGRLRPRAVKRGPACAHFLSGRARLEAWPLDQRRDDVEGCVLDPRFALLAARLSSPARAFDPLSRLRPVAVPGPARIQWLSLRDNDVEDVLLAALAAPRPPAQRPFVLANVSRLHARNLIDGLALARARGTTVSIAVGAFLGRDAGGTTTAEHLLSRLAQEQDPASAGPTGVYMVRNRFISGGSFFHDKAAIVGDKRGARLFFSSANWSAQGLSRSDESALVIDDPHLVALFARHLLQGRALADIDTVGDAALLADVLPCARFATARCGAPEEAVLVLAVRGLLAVTGGTPTAESPASPTWRTDRSEPTVHVGVLRGPPGTERVVGVGGRAVRVAFPPIAGLLRLDLSSAGAVP